MTPIPKKDTRQPGNLVTPPLVGSHAVLLYLCRDKKNGMMKERPIEDLRKEEFLKLSELARLLPVTRPLLAKYALFDLLPWHIPPGRNAKYYRLDEVKRVLRAIEPLRAKEIPKKYLRDELNRLTWYREMRARESEPEAEK